MTEPRDVSHLGDPFTLWCGFCGAQMAFNQLAWESQYVEPPCPRCGEHDWRDEVDEIVSPDYREDEP